MADEWIERFSQSRQRTYYYNERTKESQWEAPLTWVPDETSGGGGDLTREVANAVSHELKTLGAPPSGLSLDSLSQDSFLKTI